MSIDFDSISIDFDSMSIRVRSMSIRFRCGARVWRHAAGLQASLHPRSFGHGTGDAYCTKLHTHGQPSPCLAEPVFPSKAPPASSRRAAEAATCPGAKAPPKASRRAAEAATCPRAKAPPARWRRATAATTGSQHACAYPSGTWRCSACLRAMSRLCRTASSETGSSIFHASCPQVPSSWRHLAVIL